MKRTIAVVLVALLATTGLAAAAPGGPAEGPANAEPGPPGGLPDVVPDFVSTILDLVGDFVSGVLDGDLGSAVSDAAGGPGA